jgi:hypothetical protein
MIHLLFIFFYVFVLFYFSLIIHYDPPFIYIFLCFCTKRSNKYSFFFLLIFIWFYFYFSLWHDLNTSRSFPHSRLITGFVTRLTRRVPLVELKLLTLPEHLSSPPVFSGVRVTRSLVLYVCFVDRCLSFCVFSFGHCVVCSSSIYGFWLSLWYLQALLRKVEIKSYEN